MTISQKMTKRKILQKNNYRLFIKNAFVYTIPFAQLQLWFIYYLCQMRSEEVKIPIPKQSPQLSPALIPACKASSQLLQRLLAEGVPQPSLPLCSSLSEAADIYHREYHRLFALNQEANRRLASVITERNELADRYNSLKRAKGSDDYVKRKRRQAKDIAREYFCPMEKCRKGYGSEGSLTHHVRLKHKEYFDSGKYELFLQQYLEQIAQKAQGKRDDEKGEQQIMGKERKENNSNVKGKKQDAKVKEEQITIKSKKQRNLKAKDETEHSQKQQNNQPKGRQRKAPNKK